MVNSNKGNYVYLLSALDYKGDEKKEYDSVLELIINDIIIKTKNNTTLILEKNGSEYNIYPKLNDERITSVIWGGKIEAKIAKVDLEKGETFVQLPGHNLFVYSQRERYSSKNAK